jgi:tetratricopeptide (TPR) repeat protein
LNRSIRILRRPVVALALLLFGAGCATFAPPSEGPGREVRPEASAEYDVLVYHQHLLDGRLPEAKAALERALEKDPEAPFLHRRLAELLARDSQLEEAIRHARIAFEQDTSDDEARALLAQLYRIEQNVDGAEDLLLDEAGTPRDSESAWWLYQLYLEAGAFDRGHAIATWMTENEPDELRGWIALATVLERLGRPIEAEAALRRSLDVDPENLRIYGQLARMMRLRGDPEGAIGVYREMLARSPDDHATLFALAEAQIGDEDLEGAIDTLERVEASYPNDLESVKRLGYLLYDVGRFEEAGQRFERVLALAPRDNDVAFFLGVVLRRSNRNEEAAQAFSRIAAQHEYYADARTQLAAIHERGGRYEEALADVQRAMDTEPSRELELYSATLRAKTGDFDGAVAYLEALLAAAPEDDELLYNLGVVYAEDDRDEEAIAYMERALEENPDNADALNFIGYTWAEHGRNLEEAEAYIVRAIELRPDNGYIVDSLGWVYYMRARPLIEAGDVAAGRKWLDRALEELERAHELTGGDPVISEHIGDAYLLMKEPRRALDKFEEAALMGPRLEEQPELHEKLESLRRELE